MLENPPEYTVLINPKRQSSPTIVTWFSLSLALLNLRISQAGLEKS